MADLAVAVAEGGVGELERDDRRPVGAVAAPGGVLDLLDQRAAHQRGQEVLDDDPLVMPHGRPPRGVEALDLVDAVLAQAVDEPVVRADQAVVQLGDEDVHVVARIAEQRRALRVARHVAIAVEQLRGIARVIEEGRAHRPGAVEALEVGPRRAEVRDRRRVGVRADRRAVGGDVVGDELPEERPAGRRDAVVAGRVAAVAQPARRSEREQRRLVAPERRQVREGPPVASADRRDGRVDRSFGSKAVVADRVRGDGHGRPRLPRRPGASALRAGAGTAPPSPARSPARRSARRPGRGRRGPAPRRARGRGRPR